MYIKATIVAYAFSVQCFENATIVAYADLRVNSYVRDEGSRKKTDFTVDLVWWGEPQ